MLYHLFSLPILIFTQEELSLIQFKKYMFILLSLLMLFQLIFHSLFAGSFILQFVSAHLFYLNPLAFFIQSFINCVLLFLLFLCLKSQSIQVITKH